MVDEIDNVTIPTNVIDQTDSTTGIVNNSRESDLSCGEYEYVRGDIKKILFILSALLILLTITLIVNSRTPFFANLSNWIYKIANIQSL